MLELSCSTSLHLDCFAAVTRLLRQHVSCGRSTEVRACSPWHHQIGCYCMFSSLHAQFPIFIHSSKFDSCNSVLQVLQALAADGAGITFFASAGGIHATWSDNAPSEEDFPQVHTCRSCCISFQQRIFTSQDLRSFLEMLSTDSHAPQ